MSSHNNALWQTVTFLFLSKLSLQASQPFAQKMLINAKNVDLAQRFAAMTGNTSAAEKSKLALLKALKQLEKNGWVQRIDEDTIQLSAEGMTKMATEVQSAMLKIAANFPDATATKQAQPKVN